MHFGTVLFHFRVDRGLYVAILLPVHCIEKLLIEYMGVLRSGVTARGSAAFAPFLGFRCAAAIVCRPYSSCRGSGMLGSAVPPSPRAGDPASTAHVGSVLQVEYIFPLSIGVYLNKSRNPAVVQQTITGGFSVHALSRRSVFFQSASVP